MEVKNKNLHFCELICLMCIMAFFLSGCGKKFWEYNSAWVLEEPYIYLPPTHENVIIEIDGEKYEAESSWENDGTQIYFYKSGGAHSEETIIWEAGVEIKREKLYLTIQTDNIADNEGKVFVLEQQSEDEEE